MTMKLNFQEIGIGCGQNFILIKNIMDFYMHYLMDYQILYQLLLNFFLFILNKKEKKNLFQRDSWIYNASMGKSSSL